MHGKTVNTTEAAAYADTQLLQEGGGEGHCIAESRVGCRERCMSSEGPTTTGECGYLADRDRLMGGADHPPKLWQKGCLVMNREASR